MKQTTLKLSSLKKRYHLLCFCVGCTGSHFRHGSQDLTGPGEAASQMTHSCRVAEGLLPTTQISPRGCSSVLTEWLAFPKVSDLGESKAKATVTSPQGVTYCHFFNILLLQVSLVHCRRWPPKSMSSRMQGSLEAILGLATFFLSIIQTKTSNLPTFLPPVVI